MSASMTENISRRLMNPGLTTQVHKDMADDRYRDLRRPRKVRFFVNGDRFFKGKKLYITPHRYYNFNDLLNDLTGKLPSSINLPYGVRQIFTPVGGRRVSDIEDLQDGETYVCAGFEGFKVIKYGRTELEPWSVGKTVRIGQLQDADAATEASYGSYKYRGYASNAFHPGRYFRGNGVVPNPQTSRKWPGTFGNNAHRNPAGLLSGPGEAVPIKPKVVTIVRNGPRPRNNVKILLNRRSVQSYEQLVADISEAFGPKWKSNRVQKLFTTHGKEVHGVADFFREDDCFIALGSEKMSDHDVADLIDELYPDSAYAKMLLKDWEKQRRRDKHKAGREAEGAGAMKDSGFGEGSEVDSHRDEEGQPTHRSQKQYPQYQHPPHQHRSKRAMAVAMANERDSMMEDEETRSSPHGYYMLSKMERERKQAANDEREKARRRQSRLAEQERKALDEERKRRGLAPLASLNPLKPLDDIRRKDPREKDEMRKRKEEEARRKIEEEKEAERVKKEREMREQAEKAARERMAAAEKAEQQEKKEKAERESRADRESRAEKAERESRADRESRAEKAERESRAENKEKGEKESKVKAPAEKESPRAGKGTKPTADSNKAAVATAAAGKDKENKHEGAVHAAVAAVAAEKDKEAEEKDKDANNNVNKDSNRDGKPQEKERKRKREGKDKDNASEKNSTRRSKQGKVVVRRSKAERQVSSDSFVTERYELGKTLGDGNFAIVRTSRQKATGLEFAMKVIDKPKLKGKEHMVENEIDIMKDCSHPNIVKLYEEYETSDKIYLVMELVKGGDLFDAITQSVKFGEVDAAHMVKDLCNALYYLHSRSIIHRDLKPENLLVHRNKDGSVTLKLADFGLAMEVRDPIFTVCGTPTYVAPEILTEIGYGLEVDMWAVGVITYILLCGFPPFRSPDRNQTELFECIKAGEYEFLAPYWDNVSDSAKDLIRRLLVVDKSRRYNAIDVLSHPWIVCDGDTTQGLPEVPNVGLYCKEVKRDLIDQAKVNYENYQKLKERKHQEE